MNALVYLVELNSDAVGDVATGSLGVTQDLDDLPATQAVVPGNRIA